MAGGEQRIAGARLRRLDEPHGLEADPIEQRERGGDVAARLVDRIATRPVADLALGREVIRKADRELCGQPLLARAESLAVTGERGMRYAARRRGRATGEQHEPGLVAVIAVHRAVPAAGACPQRIGRLGGPPAAPEAQLVEPVHLGLRDIRLAAARRRDWTRVPAHLRAERAVVELARDRARREWF